jgi:hypothetical protein
MSAARRGSRGIRLHNYHSLRGLPITGRRPRLYVSAGRRRYGVGLPVDPVMAGIAALCLLLVVGIAFGIASGGSRNHSPGTPAPASTVRQPGPAWTGSVTVPRDGTPACAPFQPGC